MTYDGTAQGLQVNGTVWTVQGNEPAQRPLQPPCRTSGAADGEGGEYAADARLRDSLRHGVCSSQISMDVVPAGKRTFVARFGAQASNRLYLTNATPWAT
jgi:hypothetical protein